MSTFKAIQRAARPAAVAFAMVAFGPAAHSQQPSAAAVATAKELVAATKATTVFNPLIAGVVEQAKLLFLQQNPALGKDLNEIADLYSYLDTLGVDGYMLSPAYGYSAVQTTDIFMTREDIREKFREAVALLDKYNLMVSPIYLDFLRGERELECTAWGTPTFNPRGCLRWPRETRRRARRKGRAFSPSRPDAR